VEIAALPGKSLEHLNLTEGYAALGPAFVERLDPTPLPAPYLIAYNEDVGEQLGLGPAQAQRPEFLRLAAGCARFGAVKPFAAVYAGHQFGSYVSQLGDGRAITLGEVETADGSPLEWQIKGGGPTAFSRFGDGRAVLRSTIREYLCSEAMAGLGIPTTRALAIAGSDEPIYRESVETAAVLTRIAPSHLRFGHFEFFHYQNRPAQVKTLADYAIRRFFPEIATIADDAERYAQLLATVSARTASLVAHWQAVGFAHGVMNTDNMSLLGLTLDYGPFGFLDAYVPSFICNHTDSGGRYAYDRQPAIARWNCQALGAALSTLISVDDARTALTAFDTEFARVMPALLRAKFGLARAIDGDGKLMSAGLDALALHGVDYTVFFRALSRFAPGNDADQSIAALFPDNAYVNWRTQYVARLALEERPESERHAAMLATNPAIVLRNYLAQETIEAAQAKDYKPLADLHAALREPFTEREDRARFAAPPPPGASAIEVSCSS
jgi:uncharacterized protein YdiU (UPF0061 family)